MVKSWTRELEREVLLSPWSHSNACSLSPVGVQSESSWSPVGRPDGFWVKPGGNSRSRSLDLPLPGHLLHSACVVICAELSCLADVCYVCLSSCVSLTQRSWTLVLSAFPVSTGLARIWALRGGHGRPEATSQITPSWGFQNDPTHICGASPSAEL